MGQSFNTDVLCYLGFSMKSYLVRDALGYYIIALRRDGVRWSLNSSDAIRMSRGAAEFLAESMGLMIELAPEEC